MSPNWVPDDMIKQKCGNLCLWPSSDVNKQHTIADDLESLLHVLTWTMLCYVPHKMNAVALDSHFWMVFDEYIPSTATVRNYKGVVLAANKYIPTRLELKWDSPLLKLLQVLSVPYIYVYGEPHEVTEHLAHLYNRQADVDLYNKHTALANSPEWFERTMDAVLNNKNISWPEDDGSLALSHKCACSPSPTHSNEENMTKHHH
ncbi:hypothetical protein V8B97DRAFT_1535293 [Scleroderma yunnanense]